MSETQHVQSLDAVRAVAIGGVLMVHAGTPGFEAGWLGVDLFFALSGFLITTLLMSEHERVGKISYRNFLVRRCMRLFPAYIIYVSFLTYAIWGWSGSLRSNHGGWTPEGYTLALWTYVVNFAPKGGLWNGQIIAVHLWSLAVEQQYYLVWPLLVIALARRPRALLAFGIILSVVTSLSFVLTTESLYKTSLLPTRGFTLVVASTFAIACMQHRGAVARLPLNVISGIATSLVISVFFLSAVHVLSADQVERMLPLLTIAFAFCLIALWYKPLPEYLKPAMLNPVVCYIGKISYGIYLYHELIRVGIWYFAKPLMSTWPAPLGFATRLSLYVSLSIILASLSYEFIEKRFLNMRGSFRA